MIKALQNFYWNPATATGTVAVSGDFKTVSGTGEVVSRAVRAESVFRWDSYFMDAVLDPGAGISALFSVSRDCVKWSAWSALSELPALPFLKVKLELTAATLNWLKVFFHDSAPADSFSLGDRMVRDLPQGLMYNRHATGNISSGELRATGNVLDALDTLIQEFQDQLFPDRATWGLSLWEEALELTITPNYDLQTRRNLVVSKIISKKGISRPVFEELLLKMGYTATIHEYYPEVFKVGHSAVGSPLYIPEAVFCWSVIVAATGGFIKMFRVGQAKVGDALYAYDDFGDIEPTLERLKPSHTNVSFIYS